MHLYFTLRVDAELALQIYNVAGEPVWQTRAQGRAGKNLLRWDGANGAGSRCASGAYVLRLGAHGVDGTQETLWERTVIAR
jgi:hypothetical protein